MAKKVDKLKALYINNGGAAEDVAKIKRTADMIDALANLITVDKVVASPECRNGTMYGKSISDMQTGLNVTKNAIIGTVKKLTDGQLVDHWGEGYFMALKFVINDPSLTFANIQVGLNNLVTLDEDLNGAFLVADKDEQTFKIVVTDNDGNVFTKEYDLSHLNLVD